MPSGPAASREFDVLAVGDLNADLVLSGCWPQPGKERLAVDINYTLGSSAAIFACNLAALGARVTFASRVGDDAPGRFLAGGLASGGVDVSGVRFSPGLKTGITVVLNVPGREQKALLTYRGAMEQLAEPDIPDALLARARHLHVASYYLLPGLWPGGERLFQRAKAAGLSTSLDTNDDPSEAWAGGLPELLRYVDVFLPNRREALSLARETDLCRAIETLAAGGPIVAAKADAEGALLLHGLAAGAKPLLRVPAIPVEFVEATGAGDSFDAGFLFRYLAGNSLDDCLRFANACGALAVTAAGGTEAFRRPDLLARLNALMNHEAGKINHG